MNQPAATIAPSQTLSDKQMHKALAHHQGGRLKEAEEYYRQVLRLTPEHPDANNLLGVLLFQTNRSVDGLNFLNRAVQLKPQEAMFYYNYGVALRAAGQQEKAVEMLTKCVQLNPNQVDALNQLVEIHLKMRNWQQASHLLKRLATLHPLDAPTLRKLGESLHHQKQYKEAITFLQKACGLPHQDANTYHQLGLSLQADNQLTAAADAYQRCIELNGKIAPAHNNLAIVLAEQGQHERAVEHYRKTMELNPDLFQTKCNLGGLLRKTGELEESVQWLRSAVEQKPDCGEAWCNLGNTLGDLGEIDEAMRCYRKAILIKPDYTQARLNRAIGLLRQEKFDDGWVEYEWRYKLKECPRRQFGKPRWDGFSLADRVLLLHAEQGFGDTLQMVRYASYLKNQGSKVVLECQKALIPLLTENGVADQIVALGDKIPDFDLHLPLMSAPSVLHPELGFLEENVPYLRPKAELVEKWGEVLHQYSGRRIGIFWQGNPNFKQDRFRSVSLESYQPLFDMPDTHIVSLQKGVGVEQIDTFQGGQLIRLEGMDEQGGAFMDSAAIMQHLDLVVTSDSSIVHLAGAMGIRTCLLLPFAADWRWFLERPDSPWYPSLKLFRKSKAGQWKDVVEHVVEWIESQAPSAVARLRLEA